MEEKERNTSVKEPIFLYGVDTFTRISSLAKQLVSQDVHIYLFGSRARGDNRSDSDWDLLILFNKQKIEESDYEKYFDSFTELSWKINQQINPQLYTMNDWKKMSFTPFYANVEQDKILIA
ncbi:MAG: nucleotidyltransferase domain-containing protein [Bacteroidales bacterium]|nr:nucleotidyltransferase domain-containing protein [Bacteroidales bacterium]